MEDMTTEELINDWDLEPNVPNGWKLRERLESQAKLIYEAVRLINNELPKPCEGQRPEDVMTKGQLKLDKWAYKNRDKTNDETGG